MVAGGTNGKVWFWDRRQRTLLQSMSDTHMDMVTVAAFHPLQPHLFFSASDDGLIAAFDFSQGFSEDDGFAVRPPSAAAMCASTATTTPIPCCNHRAMSSIATFARVFEASH